MVQTTALSWVGICLLIVAPIWTAFATTGMPPNGFRGFRHWRLLSPSASGCSASRISSVSYLLTGGATEVPGYIRSLILIAAGLGFPLVENILKYFKFRV